MNRRFFIIGAALIFLFSSCTILNSSSRGRLYDAAEFSFTIPPGWKTDEEVWTQYTLIRKEYKNLGVKEIIQLQHPPRQGRGRAFFTVASSPMTDELTLEERFLQTYQALESWEEIMNPSILPFEQGEMLGFQIYYERFWGVPLWSFRDVWLENDRIIYVLSFHTDSFEEYSEIFEVFLKSFNFKN